MRDIRERLKRGPPILADGAMGSLLQHRGHAGCLELLNLQSPEAVRQVHRDYLEAGAEILWTNSFGGSPQRLATADLAGRTEEVNEAAARIAREAAGQNAWVAGAVGPCGVPLAPRGDLDLEHFLVSAKRQIRGLREGGADAIVIETMVDLTEALLALRAAKEIAPEHPVFVTLTFEESPNGLFTACGLTPAEVAARLDEEGADVIGANCGTGPKPMIEIAKEMREVMDRPLLFRPSAGLPTVTDKGAVWPETPETFAAAIQKLEDLGTAIVGGCCGTTPAHIKFLSCSRPGS